MPTEESTLQQIRTWLRKEAIESGNSGVYKAFLQRSSEAMVWPVSINGNVVAFAVTNGSEIETYHVKTGLKSREWAANCILADMADKSYVIAWVAETDRKEREFWEGLGLRPKGKGMSVHLQDMRWPIDPRRIKGAKKRVEVKYYDRSRNADQRDLPFAELDCVGILTAEQQLHLPELAIAFDGQPETNVGPRWVSVRVDGELVVEAELGSAKARELGMKKDPAGVPYVAIIDLYTPTIL
ncbi:hypothetical protein HFO56_03320 [Rhizobium laguerreae]|uniref:hypothetical protein n=1 Tax=Rhizobium laguerreae TaxID=1076926 RepID=UPI001C91529A|nr:hypothetical protein [Rhizobium laguerreae]MBY3151418.1 hypothetical protein [Rhizobium laguerreae]